MSELDSSERARSGRGEERTIRPVVVAGGVFGFGLGGLIDVLVMHHVLQAHHTVSGWVDPNSLEGLRTNVFADGVLGTVLLGVVLVGVALLFRAGERPAVVLSRRAFAGATILGWGVFNVVDDVVNHRLLEAHHVVHGPERFWWNTGFLVVSLGVIAVGWYLIYTAEQ